MDIQWHLVTKLDTSRKEWAESRIRKLAEGRRDLIHVVIHVESSNHHQHGAAEAKIRCQAKGREIIVHERDEEPEIALASAIDVFEREVRNMRARRRDHRAVRPAPPIGEAIADEAGDEDEDMSEERIAFESAE
jgi:ribosome-associated translation inhibitor RaiA